MKFILTKHPLERRGKCTSKVKFKFLLRVSKQNLTDYKNTILIVFNNVFLSIQKFHSAKFNCNGYNCWKTYFHSHKSNVNLVANLKEPFFARLHSTNFSSNIQFKRIIYTTIKYVSNWNLKK